MRSLFNVHSFNKLQQETMLTMFPSEIFSSPDKPNSHPGPCNAGPAVSKIAGQQARTVKCLEGTATHLSLCT